MEPRAPSDAGLSEPVGEVFERDRYTILLQLVDCELVVAATKVLHEGVTGGKNDAA